MSDFTVKEYLYELAKHNQAIYEDNVERHTEENLLQHYYRPGFLFNEALVHVYDLITTENLNDAQIKLELSRFPTQYERATFLKSRVKGHVGIVVEAAGGYEGDGESVERVVAVFKVLEEVGDSLILDNANRKLGCMCGYYNSYEGTEWDSMDELQDIVASPVTIVQYSVA